MQASPPRQIGDSTVATQLTSLPELLQIKMSQSKLEQEVRDLTNHLFALRGEVTGLSRGIYATQQRVQQPQSLAPSHVTDWQHHQQSMQQPVMSRTMPPHNQQVTQAHVPQNVNQPPVYLPPPQ